VVLTGARQTGKSTLVEAPPVGENRTYRSLDDFDVLELAEKRPELLVRGTERLTIDEVQRAPSLLFEIKRVVDRKRRAGRFLLTGSQNLLMMRRIAESLAGRAIYLTLWPMTVSEKRGAAAPGPWSDLLEARSLRRAETRLQTSGATFEWQKAALAGGYPVPALQLRRTERSQWFEGYVRTYLERDLQELAAVSALADFRRLMKLAALRNGQMLNQTDLARDAALTQPTTHRYLNLLETSYQILRVPAYAVSRTKRLVKSPKLFWTDTGLASHLAGFVSEADLVDSFGGALVESLVLNQILVWRETVSPRPEIYYWRTHGGNEVDFVVEWKRKLLPIEVKRSSRLRLSDVSGLETFLSEYSERARIGVVFYGGGELQRLGDRILAAPLAMAFD
jgi:predicted AAA+ superfamily ATPase